jgi:hypothetical protein
MDDRFPPQVPWLSTTLFPFLKGVLGNLQLHGAITLGKNIRLAPVAQSVAQAFSR